MTQKEFEERTGLKLNAECYMADPIFRQMGCFYIQ